MKFSQGSSGNDLIVTLNHVCEWTNHGWKRITAAEAELQHPGGTVSACSGLFMCELCGQFVTFTNGPKKARHFKHSSNEANKNCPERYASTIGEIESEEGKHDLPIRLKVINNVEIEFELGFIPIPENLLNQCQSSKIIIRNGNEHVYHIAERFCNDNINYFPIGKEISESYEITLDPENNLLQEYWPKTVEGIFDPGTIFDAATRKKLPKDANVITDHKYYLLTRSQIYSSDSITAKFVCESNKYYLYEIKAVSFNEEAARFFLKYHYRLSEKAIKITVLWPAYIETPSKILHSSDKMFVSLQGQSELNFYPPSIIHKQDNNLYWIKCNERQQLISTGRINALSHLYLWKDSLATQTTPPQISITDFEDNKLDSGEQNKLPRRKSISITSEVDGYALVLNDREILERYDFKANDKIQITSIKFGQTIEVFQGLDLVWKAIYSRKIHASSDDQTLLKKLEAYRGEFITVPHTVKAIASKMNNYQHTQQWLYKCIRKGKISRMAYKALKQYFIDSKEKS